MANADDAWAARLEAYAAAYNAAHQSNGKVTAKHAAKIASEDVALYSAGLGETGADVYGSTDPGDEKDTSPGSGITYSDDSKQLAALNKLIKSSLAKARDTKLGNINRARDAIISDIRSGYDVRAQSLLDYREDNEKATSDQSFANLLNRARERSSILENAAVQGAGESDTLKAQTMALRNWDSNQNDINRSYFDTNTSINANIRDLNADTRTAQLNAWLDAEGDREQTWANYYNQLSDAYSAKGGIESNKYSQQYNAGSTAYDDMATTSGKSYKTRQASSSIRNWEGSAQAEEGQLNNTNFEAASTNLAEKKPEGATLRKW